MEIEINSGICGHVTTVSVENLGDYRVGLRVSGGCENVERLVELLPDEIDALAELFSRSDKGVLDVARETLPHSTCPVPVGILKAVEAGAGLALPGDAGIKFKS